MSDYIPLGIFLAGGLLTALIGRRFAASDSAGATAAAEPSAAVAAAVAKMRVASAVASGLSSSQDVFHDCPCSVSAECDCTLGFQRPEFLSKEGAFTRLAYYDKHIFVCCGMLSTEWPEKIEEGAVEEDNTVGRIIRALVDALKPLRRECKTKLGVVEEGPSNDALLGQAVDIIIMPDAIRYKNVTLESVASVVQAHFIDKKPLPALGAEEMTGSHVFVCCHHKRDGRCGQCGPRVYKSLVEKLEPALERNASALHVKCKQAKVYRTSDVGGHKFAANLVIFKYSPDMRRYYGDWYGYVNENEDCQQLVDDYLIRGKIVKQLWRGRCAMDLEPEKFLKFAQ